MSGAQLAWIGKGMNDTMPLWLKIPTAMFELYLIVLILRITWRQRGTR